MSDDKEHDETFGYDIITGVDGTAIAVSSEGKEEVLGDGSGIVCSSPDRRHATYNEADYIDVAPGIKVARVLIDAVTDGPNANGVERRHAFVSHRRAEMCAELAADIQIAKGIGRALFEQTTAKVVRKEASEALLEDAILRQNDASIQFVPVKDESPVAAAKRLLQVKEAHPEWDIEPVDLTDVLKDVKQLNEVELDNVTHVMHVKKHQAIEAMPERIRFAVPDRDIDASAAEDGSCNTTFTLHTYVQLDALPIEVQRLIRSCLEVRSPTFISGDVPARLKRVCMQVDELKDSSDALRDSTIMNVDDSIRATVPRTFDSSKWSKLAGL